MHLGWVILLGIVQGIAEFLPVSSSGHLVVASWFMSGKALPLSFNTALHLGTLIAVLSYFFYDWLAIAKGVFAPSDVDERIKSRKLLMALVVGSIPAAVIGLNFKDAIEHFLHRPEVIWLPLAGVGILMWWVDRRFLGEKSLEDVGLKSGLMIGVAQACALVPGVSRSGATITCARYLGLDRESAARFSFLLGTPAMLGACLLQFREVLAYLTEPVFAVGVATSTLTGLWAIRFFLKFVQQYGFGVYAIYRVGLAGFILLGLGFGW